MVEHLTTDCLATLPPQLAAATSMRSLNISKRSDFELAAGAVDTLLALPHLYDLWLPELSEAGRQRLEQLQHARPGLRVHLA